MSSSEPRVTWLMSVLNGMPFLPETLACVEAQTYKDAELLALDCGSTDGTLEELNRWIPARIPGRVMRREMISLGAALALLVEECGSEYCARIDADDLTTQDRLQKQVKFLDQHPEVAVVGGDYVCVDSANREVDTVWRQPKSDAEVRWLVRFGCPYMHSAVLFRRSAILQIGNYRDVRVQDYDLWMRIAPRFEMVNLDEVLVRYRVHDRSIMAQCNRDMRLLTRLVSEDYKDDLFSGLSGDEALRLQSIVERDAEEPVRWTDFGLLRRAAEKTALSLGRPADYFTATSVYRKQRKELRRNWALQFAPVRWAVYAKRGLRRLVSN